MLGIGWVEVAALAAAFVIAALATPAGIAGGLEADVRLAAEGCCGTNRTGLRVTRMTAA